MPQAIIEIGFNAVETKRQASEVYVSIKSVLDVARELNGIKINISDWSAGIRDFKANADAAIVTQAKLAGTIETSNKAIINQAKVRKVNADAERSEALAQTAKIKQNDAEIASETKLAAAKERTRKAEQMKQEVPYTIHTNFEDAAGLSANATGTIVTEAELAATQAQLEATAAMNQERQASIPIIQEQSVATTELADITAGYTGSLQQNIAIQLENEAALAANKATQRDIKGVIAESGRMTDAQNVRLIQLREEEVLLTTQNQKLSLSIREQIKVNNAEVGSLEALRAELSRLTISYEQLSVAQKQSQFGVQMKRQIDVLVPAVEKASAETAAMAATTVRATNSIVTGAKTAFSFVRQLAYILPGIGIAGIFNLVFIGIGKVVDALHLFGAAEEESGYKAKTATEQIKEQTDKFAELQDTILESTKSAVEAGIKLQAYVNIAKDGTKPLWERNEALKEANKILGDHAEKLTIVNINTAHMTEEVQKVTQALIQEAVAAKYADAIADLTIKQTNQTKAQSKAMADLNGAYKYNKTLIEEAAKAGKDVSIFTLADIDIYKKGVEETGKLLGLTQKQIAELYGDFSSSLEKSVNLFGKTTDKGKKNVTDLNKAIKEAYELQKAIYEAEIQDLEKVAKDENNLYNFRAEAAIKASDLKQDLAFLTFHFQQKMHKDELLNEFETTRDILKSQYELSDQLKQIYIDRSKLLLDTPIVTPKKYYEQQLADLKKLHDEGLMDEADYVQRFNEIQLGLFNIMSQEDQNKQILADHKKFLDEFVKQLEEANKTMESEVAINSLKEQSTLIDQYLQGKISKEQYEKDKVEITRKYAQIALSLTIGLLKAELSLYDPLSAKAIEIKKKIEEAGLAIKGLDFQSKTDDVDGLTKALQDVAQITGNVTQAFTDLTSISLDNHKTQLEEIGAQQDKNYEQEVQHINDSKLTQEQKDHALTVLAAQHQAQQEENQRKQREYDNKKAEYDKTASIMNIIVSTLAAAAKAGWITPIAIAIEIAGAAALVKAIATKVPHYKEGVKSSKKGWALTDEAGAELYEDPSGDMYIGNNAPTLRYLRAGTRVTPASEVNEILNRSMTMNTAMILQEPKEHKRDDSADRIVKAIMVLAKKKTVVKNYNNIGREIKFGNWVDKNVRGQ